jgi:hypothetical protein
MMKPASSILFWIKCGAEGPFSVISEKATDVFNGSSYILLY